MDDTLEYPDDGLRARIHKGFSASARCKSKKIAERPKTPGSDKGKSAKCVLISKDVTEIKDIKLPKAMEKKSSNKKEKKPVVRKQKSEITDVLNKLTLKQKKEHRPVKKEDKKDIKKEDKKDIKKDTNAVYLCPTCDKSYKSKTGIKKHMEKCK